MAKPSLKGTPDILQGCVRYGTYRGIPAVYTAGITGTRHFCKFGTTSIPVPDTSVTSVRHQFRYRTFRYVRYINTGTGHFGNFSTTSIPVPDTSVTSVRHPYRFREYRYRTEHTLDILYVRVSHTRYLVYVLW